MLSCSVYQNENPFVEMFAQSSIRTGAFFVALEVVQLDQGSNQSPQTRQERQQRFRQRLDVGVAIDAIDDLEGSRDQEGEGSRPDWAKAAFAKMSDHQGRDVLHELALVLHILTTSGHC